MLHHKMYNDVWSWAGAFIKTEKNIGIRNWMIPKELRKLLDDTLYWIDHESYSPDELAIRFKHHIVSIHCFSNGNRRHSRLMADIIIDEIFEIQVYTWGAANLVRNSNARIEYLDALRAADSCNYKLLLEFSRS